MPSLRRWLFRTPIMDDDGSIPRDDEYRWAALMVNAQAGNESDYRQLLQELSDVIFRYLLRRFGHHHFIEDCVQESLVAIHQARHTYDQRRPFRPWLFAIVRHKAIDTLRKQRSHERSDDHQFLQSQEDHVPATGNLEENMERDYLINSLPLPHREAITLTKLNGFSTAEAAAHLRISEGALKVRIHRGINRLKRLIEADAL
jgi:RNA polymerase sigma-70 factor, ECF subfamily